LLTSTIGTGKTHFSDYTFRGSEGSILKWALPIFNPWASRKLKEVLTHFQPDVVHLHGICEQTSPSILLHLKHYPTVLTTHDNDLVGPGESKYVQDAATIYFSGRPCYRCTSRKGYIFFLVKHLVRRRLLRHIDLFITTNQRTKQALERQSLKPVQKIPYGLRLFMPSPIAQPYHLLFAGRLAEQKGVQYLLDAMPTIIERFPQTRLQIVGTGPDGARFKEQATRLQLNDVVTFTGFVPYRHIESYYHWASIVLVPSIWQEPFALIGPEAMSVGRPLVASDVGGIPEWLQDGETGYLVPPQNTLAIADRVIRLFSDHALMQQMGQNAYRAAQAFDLDAHTEAILAVYRQVGLSYWNALGACATEH
jgi:glycosyltransferase involved in cell wall biosynthesis